MGEFDDLAATEPGDEWDDMVSEATRFDVAPAPLRCAVRLPNLTVEVRGVDSARCIATIGDLLADLTSDDLHQSPDAPTCVLELHEAGATWFEHPAGLTEPDWSSDDDEFVEEVLQQILELAAVGDPLRVHLEVACVQIGECGLVLSGDMTRTVAAITVELLLRGATHLSTGNLSVTPGSRTAYGLPRPLTVANSRPIVASTLAPIRPHTHVDAVLVVRDSDGQAPSIEPIPSHVACAELMGDVLDGHRLDTAALEVVAAVVSGAQCWELRCDRAVDGADLVESLDLASRTPPGSDQHLATPNRRDTASNPAELTSGRSCIRSVRFSDGAVVSAGQPPVVVGLDSDDAAAFEAVMAGTHPTRREDFPQRLLAAGIEPPRASPVPPVPMTAYGLPNTPTGLGELSFWSPPPGRGRTVVDRLVRSTRDATMSSQVAAVVLETIGQQTHAPGTDAGMVVELAERRLESARAAAHDSVEMLAEAIDALNAIDVEPLVVGAIIQAHDASTPTWLVEANHIDLLVRPDELHRAEQALTGEGLTKLDPDAESQTAGGDAQPAAAVVEVELHDSLAAGPFGELVNHDDLRSRSVPVRIGATWVRALHPEDRFVVSCIQADAAGVSATLQQRRDIVMSAPRADALMASVMESSERWGATTTVTAMLRRTSAELPGLSPWLVERARRYVNPQRDSGVLRRRGNRRRRQVS